MSSYIICWPYAFPSLFLSVSVSVFVRHQILTQLRGFDYLGEQDVQCLLLLLYSSCFCRYSSPSVWFVSLSIIFLPVPVTQVSSPKGIHVMVKRWLLSICVECVLLFFLSLSLMLAGDQDVMHLFLLCCLRSIPWLIEKHEDPLVFGDEVQTDQSIKGKKERERRKTSYRRVGYFSFWSFDFLSSSSFFFSFLFLPWMLFLCICFGIRSSLCLLIMIFCLILLTCFSLWFPFSLSLMPLLAWRFCLCGYFFLSNSPDKKLFIARDFHCFFQERESRRRAWRRRLEGRTTTSINHSICLSMSYLASFVSVCPSLKRNHI